MAQPKRAAAPAVARAAAVLGYLSDNPTPQRLSDIASALGIAVSSSASLCNALEDSRLISRKSDGYVLGLRLLELAHNLLSTIDPLTSFNDVISSSETLRHHTVQMAMLDNDEVLYLARRDADQPFQISSNVGKRLPASCTAVGKALLADIDAGSPPLPEVLPELTEHSITDPDALALDLGHTAERGYAVDDEETSVGVICFGVALPHESPDPRYAISVTILKANHSDRLETLLVESLAEAANALRPRIRSSTLQRQDRPADR